MTAPPRMNRTFGSTSNIMIKANELEYSTQMYVDTLARFTGRPKEQVCWPCSSAYQVPAQLGTYRTSCKRNRLWSSSGQKLSMFLRLQLRKEVGRNRYFTPQQAIEYGIIDKVVTPQDGSQASAAVAGAAC
jgi:ATP-dependent Clp protease, protease subunit